MAPVLRDPVQTTLSRNARKGANPSWTIRFQPNPFKLLSRLMLGWPEAHRKYGGSGPSCQLEDGLCLEGWSRHSEQVRKTSEAKSRDSYTTYEIEQAKISSTPQNASNPSTAQGQQ